MLLQINTIAQDTIKKMLDIRPVEPDTLKDFLKTSPIASGELNDFLTHGWERLVIVLAVIALITYLCANDRHLKRGLKYLIDEHLGKLMAVVWILGFVTYSVGGHLNMRDDSFISAAPMAMIHSTEMFFFQSDISAIKSDCAESLFFMTLYNVSHLSAAILSLVFLIKTFGKNLVYRIKLAVASRTHRTRQNIYVMWGINDYTASLAKDIRARHFSPKDDMILFVRTFEDDDPSDDEVGVSRLLHHLVISSRELDVLDDIPDCYMVSNSQQLSQLQIDDDETGSREGIDILGKELKLKSLYQLMNRQEGNQATHFFFLSYDLNANVRATINLLTDKTVKEKNVTIYCRARKSAKTHWLESYDYCHNDEKTKVKIIDTSYLSVSHLKQNWQTHPVNSVSIDPETAAITSPFNSMVIGFGGTGTEAVKYLYEFGAFIGNDGKKTPFHCTVIDDNMEKYRGAFEVQTPALSGSNEIELVSCPLDGDRYWQILQSLIQTLNYCIIALGDDDLSIETVANFCNMAIKWRDTDAPLHIYVRAYLTDNRQQLQNICDNINAKYKTHNIQVTPFGTAEEIFTYANIIDDSLLDQAKVYNYFYENQGKIADGLGSITEKELNEKWEQVLGIQMKIKVATADGRKKNLYYTPKEGTHTLTYEGKAYSIKDRYSIDDINEIERKRDQNLSNTLHKYTKYHILSVCRATDEPIPPLVEENLSRIEHERWMAYMKLNGWQRADLTTHERSVSKRLHEDMCPWEEIRSWDEKDQKETRSYDTLVVRTSLALVKKELADEEYID